jgi:hypothetical protein
MLRLSVRSHMRPFTTNSIPTFAAGTLAAIGTGVMVGWTFSIDTLMTVFPGLVRMKPNTSLGFLLAACALCAASQKRFGRVQAGCAAYVALLGTKKLGRNCECLCGEIEALV